MKRDNLKIIHLIFLITGFIDEPSGDWLLLYMPLYVFSGAAVAVVNDPVFFYVPCFFLTVIAVVAIDVIVAVAPDAVDFAVIIAVVIMYVYAVNVAVYSIDAPSTANISVFVSCLVYAVALVLLLFLCSGCY